MSIENCKLNLMDFPVHMKGYQRSLAGTFKLNQTNLIIANKN